MTVAELINHLRTFPQDMPVMVRDSKPELSDAKEVIDVTTYVKPKGNVAVIWFK